MNCPNCKMSNPAGAEFCMTCGTDLPTENTQPATGGGSFKCDACGATNPADATFCSLCGAMFAAVAKTAAPAPDDDYSPSPMAPTDTSDTPQSADGEKGHTLQTKILQGKASADEVLELADIEMKKGNREEAAQLYLQAMQMEPELEGARGKFTTEFTDEEIAEWGLPIPPKPVISQIGEIVLYPFANKQWIDLSIAAAFWTVSKFMPIMGLLIGLLALAWTATLMGKHMKWAGLGKSGFPRSLDIDFNYLAYYFASFVALFVPLILVGLIMPNGPMKLIVLISLVAISVFLWPMCFLSACMFNSSLVAFRYVFLLKSIFRMFGEYFTSVLLLYFIGFLHHFAFALIPFTKFILADFVSIYLAVVYSRILGLLYYNNQKKLGWF